MEAAVSLVECAVAGQPSPASPCLELLSTPQQPLPGIPAGAILTDYTFSRDDEDDDAATPPPRSFAMGPYEAHQHHEALLCAGQRSRGGCPTLRVERSLT
mmetsp:Transcript_69956/g.130784  ORF Transcript_69956/g.130784 Transcript_69956/m.130784 type:complete len:100 (-) Transcript_69956:3-302(-)